MNSRHKYHVQNVRHMIYDYHSLGDRIGGHLISIIFLIVFKNCYGIRNYAWKFQVSTMKIVPVASIWSLCIIRIMMIQCFRKGDNIWEYADEPMWNRIISYNFLGVSKVTRDNYHQIWLKKCFMSKIYRYTWILGGTGGRSTWSTSFFVYYS